MKAAASPATNSKRSHNTHIAVRVDGYAPGVDSSYRAPLNVDRHADLKCLQPRWIDGVDRIVVGVFIQVGEAAAKAQGVLGCPASGERVVVPAPNRTRL